MRPSSAPIAITPVPACARRTEPSASGGHRMMRRALLVALLVAACHDATDAEKQRVIGAVDLLGTNPPTLVVPEAVSAGQRFTATVYTWGNSDCTLADGGSMTGVDGVVRLVPYDIIPILGHSDVCRDDCVAHAHAFGVTLTQTGPARLRV